MNSQIIELQAKLDLAYNGLIHLQEWTNQLNYELSTDVKFCYNFLTIVDNYIEEFDIICHNSWSQFANVVNECGISCPCHIHSFVSCHHIKYIIRHKKIKHIIERGDLTYASEIITPYLIGYRNEVYREIISRASEYYKRAQKSIEQQRRIQSKDLKYDTSIGKFESHDSQDVLESPKPNLPEDNIFKSLKKNKENQRISNSESTAQTDRGYLRAGAATTASWAGAIPSKGLNENISSARSISPTRQKILESFKPNLPEDNVLSLKKNKENQRISNSESTAQTDRGYLRAGAATTASWAGAHIIAAGLAIANHIVKAHFKRGKNKTHYLKASPAEDLIEVKEQKNNPKRIEAAVYAPSEIMRGDDALVQVYLYEQKDHSLVAALASQIDPDAIQRNYTPLSQIICKDDKVRIDFKVYSGVIAEETTYETIWEDKMLKHEFILSIPDSFSRRSFLSIVTIFINDIPVGDMKFKTNVVNNLPRNLWAEVKCHQYKRSFISYSHADADKIRFLAEGFKIQGVDYFFDEHSLRTGDEYPKEIDEYILSCDIFVLCWSRNAKTSDWVRRECDMALKRYKSKSDNLKIYPISIAPKADLPISFQDKFHFGHIE